MKEVSKMFIEMCFDLYNLIEKLEERSNLNIPIQIDKKEINILGWRCDFSLPEIKTLSSDGIEYIPITYLDSSENVLFVMKEISSEKYNKYNILYSNLRENILLNIKDKKNITEFSTIEDLAYLLMEEI